MRVSRFNNDGRDAGKRGVNAVRRTQRWRGGGVNPAGGRG